MKKLILLLLFLTSFSAHSQINNVNLSLGNKAVEVDYFRTNEEGLIFGIGSSLTDSKLVAKRANQFDQHHFIYNDYVPTVFALGGGNFDRLNLIAKIGSCYMNQEVDGIKDNKKIYLTIGMNINYKLTDRFGLSASFDNVNSLLLGLSVCVD